jgi:RNA polymerase sigma factor (sigma-70 family)
VREESDANVIIVSLEDPARFEAIFTRHYEKVRRYAQRRLGAEAGEDVAAQTFQVAFSNRARFDPAYESARPWLIGIATNLVRRHARSERARWRATGRFPFEPPLAEVDASTLDAQRARALIAAALAELSDVDRETFVLHVLGDLTYQEIAQLTEVPIGTVRSRIHRARGQLREQITLLGATVDEADEQEGRT